MKNSLCGALLLSAASLAGCANVSPRSVRTPAQIAAQVCPPVQATLDTLQMLPGLPVETQANLALAMPIVNGACSVGATVDLSSLQALEGTALPVLLDVVKATALSPEDQDRILAVQVVLSAAIAIADPGQSAASPVTQPAPSSAKAASMP
jgi:hypothetical protein